MSDNGKNLPVKLPEPTSYDKAAGGLDALISTARNVLEQPGLIRGVRALANVNQTEGFDCPGCAWPDPDHRSAFEFCENGAKAVADEATRFKVDPAFFENHPISELRERSGHWLNKQGRLTHPMRRRPGSDHYEPLSWEEAFSLIGQHLNALDHPDQALFYTSGRTSNEAAFLYQLLARQLGTNNLPDCSNMCHESSGTGMNEAIGVGKGTVSLDDFEQTDAIFIFGQNPGTNHPRMLSALQAARRRGTTIVAINPLKEPGLVAFQHPKELYRRPTDLADIYLQLRIGSDIALLKGLMKCFVAAEAERPGQVLDHDFIATHTRGVEAHLEDLHQTSWETIVQETGLSREQIEAAARVAIDARSLIACWAMGLTQHSHGVANIQQVINFLLMRGFMGRPGSGACPVRGHSNVQGDRTMGIWEKPTDAFLDRLGAHFGFEPPREHGLDTVGAIEAMHQGKARVFIAMGGNFLMAAPDTERTAEALERCELTVQISTKLNHSHLVTGQHALILPCLGRTERDLQAGRPQFVTVEDSMSVVQASRGHLPPASDQLMSEPRIVQQIARATFDPADSPIDWTRFEGPYDPIRDAIAAVIPGFDAFNQRIRQNPTGFVLPNGARERDFHTTSGFANFIVSPIQPLPLAEGQLVMMTIRSHDQYNTTVYGLHDRYRGIHNKRRVVLLNPADLAARGLAPGDLVDLISHFEGQERRADAFEVVAYDIPAGCAATYFPEANPLVPLQQIDRKSRTPASKSVIISLVPSRPADAA
ncbi:hypothetical protein DL240_17955 [Lujinxingia litoralis]|uniref:CbbBc protein n=1 Tax=Lujinxingia litoralis TaxID=2211119 RepID=A0A328C6X1_9DELT|nr:FdhF/YdeP family oxidoreductase [Lujinxingia litoralis]RAL20264.1 hypothetical protein DL240_17955 [Lujinxingia litoralis]